MSDGNLRLLPEYRSRVEVLRALNYIDKDDVIQLKVHVLYRLVFLCLLA